MVFKSFILTIVLFSTSAHADWIKTLDCKDGNGNQLVVDRDSEDSAELQAVLRPSPDQDSKHNVIRYLYERGAVNQAQFTPGEIIERGHPGILGERFFVSNPFMTVLVKLEGNTAVYHVRRGNTVDWYFPYCSQL